MCPANDDWNSEARTNLQGEFACLIGSVAERGKANQVRFSDPAPLRRLDVLDINLDVVTGFGKDGANERHAVVGHNQPVAEVRELTAELDTSDLFDPHTSSQNALRDS